MHIFATEFGTIYITLSMENPFAINSYESKELFCD